ncbi:MAG: hypothetical protein JXA49_02315 [Actinobacteria bacterium]|nr:hypothetical protein [Actinomycetota bacterium]
MLRKQLYRGCKKCGTPWIAGKLYKWGNDGTMGLRFRQVKSMVFLNASLYDDLMREINKEIGVPIWHLVLESNRNAGRTSLEDLFNQDDLLNKAKRYRVTRRLVINFYHELATLMGLGLSKTEKIVSREYGIARVKNPYNLYGLAGTIASAFEALDQLPYNCAWEEVGDSEFLMTCRRTQDKDVLRERLEEDVPNVLEGDIMLERCPACRTPIRVGELFEWRYEEGVLINRKSRDRWCTFVSTTLPPIFRELAKELGDDIYDFLVTTQSSWTIAHLDRLGVTTEGSSLSIENAKDAFLEYLTDFPVFGYGNPVASRIEEHSCSITVENPFFVEMLAGTLLGLFEGLFERKADINWEKTDEHKVVYTIEERKQRPDEHNYAASGTAKSGPDK